MTLYLALDQTNHASIHALLAHYNDEGEDGDDGSVLKLTLHITAQQPGRGNITLHESSLNDAGLINTSTTPLRDLKERKSCQILDFCFDCNVKVASGDGRVNFIEFENSTAQSPLQKKMGLGIISFSCTS